LLGIVGVWAERWFRRYSPQWNNAFEGNKDVKHLMGFDRRKRSLKGHGKSSTNWVSVSGLEKDFFESPQGLGHLLYVALPCSDFTYMSLLEDTAARHQKRMSLSL
jgi:hypothetical protein